MNIYIDLISDEARKGCIKTVEKDGFIYYINVPAGTQEGDTLYVKDKEGIYFGIAQVNSITGGKKEDSGKLLPILAAAAVVVIAIGITLSTFSGNKGPGNGKGNDNSIELGLEKVIESDDYKGSDYEQKGDKIKEYLDDAAERGNTDNDGNTIVPDSVYIDEGSSTCIYTDSEGGINVIQYVSEESYTDGDSGSVKRSLKEASGIKDTKGIVLFGLGDPGTKLEEASQSLVNDLNSNGSSCGYDDYVTVKDYKACLKDNDYVIIDSHGSMLNYGYGFKNESEDIVPVICTNEDIDNKNKKEYEDDIKEQRVAKVKVIDEDEPDGTSDKYWIMPSFFKKHYKSNGLNGSYIHVGTCFSFGGAMLDNSASEDHALADSLISCGASAVTGYYNSVFSFYDYNMIHEIMDGLLTGSDLDDAVNTAKHVYGEDDEDFAIQQGWLDQDSPYLESADEKIENGIAYIVIKGDNDFNFRNEDAQDYTTEPGGAKGEGYLPGEWGLQDEELPPDDLIGQTRLVFRPDLTGYTYFRAGSFEFEYSPDDDYWKFQDPGTKEWYKVIINSKNDDELTLIYPDGDKEKYEYLGPPPEE